MQTRPVDLLVTTIRVDVPDAPSTVEVKHLPTGLAVRRRAAYELDAYLAARAEVAARLAALAR